MSLHSILEVLVYINAVKVVIISMIHMLNCVFLNVKVFDLMCWSNQASQIE